MAARGWLCVQVAEGVGRKERVVAAEQRIEEHVKPGRPAMRFSHSAPHPEGAGARRAMQLALSDARLEPDDIDYINLHGTGTPSNDRSESRAVNDLFGAAMPCSSTKGATGHTLGAAGALEAVIAALALRYGEMPAGVNTRRVDPELAVNYLTAKRVAPLERALSNSFGFGGTNCSLILGRAG